MYSFNEIFLSFQFLEINILQYHPIAVKNILSNYHIFTFISIIFIWCVGRKIVFITVSSNEGYRTNLCFSK